MSGTWTVGFSLISQVLGEQVNNAALYHNGEMMIETQHWTQSNPFQLVPGGIVSSGGRETVIKAEQGDTLHLETSTPSSYGDSLAIITCFEFNPASK